MLSGEFNVLLDEKGRLMIPTKLRVALGEQILMLTKGIEMCLTLYPKEVWEKFTQYILSKYSPLEKRMRYVQRRIIAPARECALDTHGRINIPAPLIKDAQIGRECIMLGMNNFLEIWGEQQYTIYNKQNNEEIMAITEEVASNWEDSLD